MSSEIQADYSAGKNVYALVRNATGSIWNGSTFTNYVTANLATYAVTMTEQGTASGYYTGAFPAAAVGVYNVVAKERAGGSPAETDVTAGTGAVYWDGSAVVYLNTVQAVVNGVWDEAFGSHTSADSFGQLVQDMYTAVLALPASARDAVFARQFHATKMLSLTFEELVAGIACMHMAKASGQGTAAPHFRNIGDTADALVGVDDADGNRTTATFDPTAVR